ncbi:MAG: hypothetical protein CMM50_08475 [Rhodospirillaceae bacterium]|nr:hypothetical protein [Rhodospirillaceae bacterium]|tara:strand:- start:12 stop:758 length:747 start_codon:yes stop_codon:yes gene_type:complete
MHKSIRGAALAGLVALAPMTASAGPEQDKLVADATTMTSAMLADPQWSDFHRYLDEAEAVVLIPDFLKAGFIVGGAGGRCIIVVRQPDGNWSDPSFCVMGGASIGLQIGAEKSEIMLFVRTDEALNALMKNKVQLGGDAGLAIGTIGAGVSGATTTNMDADIVAFSRSIGLFGGVSLDGSVIETADKWNQEYYGEPVTAHEILMENKVSSPHADALREALSRATKAQAAQPTTNMAAATPPTKAQATR